MLSVHELSRPPRPVRSPVILDERRGDESHRQIEAVCASEWPAPLVARMRAIAGRRIEPQPGETCTSESPRCRGPQQEAAAPRPANSTTPYRRSALAGCPAYPALSACTLSTMITTAEKVKENGVRPGTECQCFALDKSPRRDTLAWDYDRYWVVDPNADLATDPLGRIVPGSLAFELHVGEVEWLPTPSSELAAFSERFSRQHDEQP